MVGSLFIVISAALVLAALVLILRQLLMVPIKLGGNTEQFVILKVFGYEQELESTLRSLLWQYENSLLRAQVVILGFNLADETREIAEFYSQQFDTFILIQDGEISQWIKNLSC